MKIQYPPVLEYCLTYREFFTVQSGKQDPSLLEIYNLAHLYWIREQPFVKEYFRVISKGEIPDFCLTECKPSCQHLDTDIDTSDLVYDKG